MNKLHWGIVIIFSVVVVAAVIYGFFVGGSPFALRDQKFDSIRLSNFSSLQYAIQSYAEQKKALPVTLGDLPSYTISYTKDPDTGKAYGYNVTASSSYELCTTFSEDSKVENAAQANSYPYYYVGPNASSDHKKGYDCISYTLPSPPPIIK